MKKTAIALGVCLIAVFFVSMMFSPPVFAQNTPAATVSTDNSFGLQSVQNTTRLSTLDFRVIIARIINVALGLLGIVTLGLILYAGFVIMTAGGNEEKIAEGRQILVNAVIGLAIIMSAYAIVAFIIRALSTATGTGNLTNGSGGTGTTQTFVASGSLGTIIRDHYPLRDQPDVPRNTRISVTFREPIDPASLIDNNPSTDDHGTVTYGRCVTPAGQTMNWQTDCDQLKASAVHIYPTGDSAHPVAAAVIAVPDTTSQQYFTYVFVPLAPIGSDTATVNYTVDLTSAIQKADGNHTSAFSADRDGHYLWQFETATTFDYTPPTVTSVYPDVNSTVPRNTIVQIHFSEAMDPSTVQGLNDSANPQFTNIVFGNSSVRGNWHVTNGYATAEFLSSEPCGAVNSCGEAMYCLPATPNCATTPNAPECQVLVRTAQLLNCPSNHQDCMVNGTASQPGQANNFAGVPGTGVTDMAGNALDGNGPIAHPVGGGIPNGKPDVQNPGSVQSSELVADNAYWHFAVANQIQNTAPSISTVSPVVDAEHVAGDVPVTITFSGRMWEDTFGNMSITEHGLNQPIPFWYRTHSSVTNDVTAAIMEHRVFGPNGDDAYYYPTIPSTVKNVNQNCLYPGRGPATPDATCSFNAQSGTYTQCVPVTNDPQTDTGCPNTGGISPTQPNSAACVSALQMIE